MSRKWKTTVIVAAVAVIVSTPVVWLLDGPNSGQLVGAALQVACGVAALLWAILRSPEASGLVDEATDTGQAEAASGGTANTGVRRPRGAGRGSARASQTGNATASGQGSSANTGVDYGDS
jgi:hypothetical protein